MFHNGSPHKSISNGDKAGELGAGVVDAKVMWKTGACLNFERKNPDFAHILCKPGKVSHLD